LQKKSGEPQGMNRKVQRREKILAPKGIHTSGCLTGTVDWENIRQILKLWMENIGLH
jgi:hypothetical protein